MNARNARPLFGREAGIGLLLSVTGGGLFMLVSGLLGTDGALRTVIAFVGGCYVLRQLTVSRRRIGRITAITLWCLSACAAWLLQPPLVLYVLIHVGLAWLVRSLYRYVSFLSVTADLGLSGAALGIAIWTLSRTGSLVLAIWCFFLLQALHVAIPATFLRRPRDHVSSGAAPACEEPFDHAHRSAQAALRRLGLQR
jgi:hypothetical protein